MYPLIPEPCSDALATLVPIKTGNDDGFSDKHRSPRLDAARVAPDRTRDQERVSSKFVVGPNIDDSGRPLRADVKSEVLWCY
jgi:hypothetical protein